MARKGESLAEAFFDLLLILPWWGSVLVSGFVYILLNFAVPSIEFSSPIALEVNKTIPSYAHLIALPFLIPAAISAFHASRKRALLERQRGIDDIKQLDWKTFEELVAEAYRRMGYRVIENSKAGADGGIDIRLRKNNETTLVQCKQWRNQSVGVEVVREMYGIMVDEQAHHVFIVCTGPFTTDAQKFATGKPIALVTGDQLQQLVSSVQSTTKQEQVSRTQEPTSSPRVCQRCGTDLVLRTAKKGPNAGKAFYGCGSFPKCRYTEQLEQAA